MMRRLLLSMHLQASGSSLEALKMRVLRLPPKSTYGRKRISARLRSPHPRTGIARYQRRPKHPLLPKRL